jgi:hypothetical protein
MLQHYDERKIGEGALLIMKRLLAAFGAAITLGGVVDRLTR